MTGPSRSSRVFEVVARSPACVAAQDRDGWLALFTRDGVVEDPVGAAPNHREVLGRFWDTFIAGNEIVFEVLEDLVCGDEVVRDVVIHTRLSTGLRIDVKAHLFYEVVDEDGAPKIRRLRAVWDLRRRSLSAIASGPRGLWTLGAVSMLMLRVQGLRSTLGYSRGLVSGIFGDGPAALQRLTAAVAAHDLATAESLFTPGALVEFPIGTQLPVRTWLERLGPGAVLRAADVTAAGFVTSFRLTVDSGAHAGAGGVGLLEFDPATRTIAAARCFLRPVPQSR